MNIGNLSEGLVLNNYKDLCSTLEVKVKSGASKKAQLKELENYIEYQKDGHRFIVTKILTQQEVVTNEIKRGRKSLYSKAVEVLLLDTLSRKDSNLIISKTSLLKELGLINENYSKGYNNPKSTAMELNMEVDMIYDFFNITNSNLTGIIKSAFKSLSDKRLVDIRDDVMVKKHNERLHRLIDPIERAQILEIDRMCMEKFNIKTISEFEKFNTNKKYHELKSYRDYLIKTKTEFQYFYKVYDIVFNHEYLEKEKLELTDFIISEMQRLDELEKLNQSFSNNLITNAKSRQYNSNNKYSVRNDDNYVEYFKMLIKEFINSNLECDESINKVMEINVLESDLPF